MLLLAFLFLFSLRVVPQVDRGTGVQAWRAWNLADGAPGWLKGGWPCPQGGTEEGVERAAKYGRAEIRARR